MALEVVVTEPNVDAGQPPLLFVHGAWHASWCWTEHFTDYFSDIGYRSYALDLTGHGASPGNLRTARIDRYVTDVRRVAIELPSSPVLVGHSMGGLVVQQYLARYRATAGVLMAPVPSIGAIGATWRVATRHPLAFLRANATLTLGPIVDEPDRAISLLFGPDMDPEDARLYATRLQDESYLAYLEMIFELPRPSRVHDPVLVLGASQDAIFSPSEIHATARAYGTEAIIFPGMGHDMMLEPAWRDVADAMAIWIGKLTADG
jgi:pimeloyl-ACP methyl ester carboxylesterase